MSPLAYGRRQLIGLGLGPALFGLTLVAVHPAGLSPGANAVLGATLWIATWWITEAVPIPVTSLLPLLLFPTLGVGSIADVAAPYADPVVFLFLGGFLVALAIERWGLHRRIALIVLGRVGADTRRLLLGFMLVTAFLSMWISNTATAMMMVPIGMAVLAKVRDLRPESGDDSDAQPLAAGPTATSNFGAGLMLGIAYAASIGGVATLIGTPPNAILAGVASSTLGVQIGFLEWLAFGLPVVAAFLPITWLVICRLLPPERRSIPASAERLRTERDALGGMGAGERRTLAVFAIVAAGWLLRPFVIEPVAPGITDTGIAVFGGVLVFVVPVDLRRGEFLLDWEAARRVPWGILLLFGAGFSIARAVQRSGLDAWIAEGLSVLRGVEFVLVLLAVGTLVVFLTEVTSNSATASLFIPVMVGLGATLAVSPLVLMVAVAIGGSFAFMLPVATPPNAIVFGSGAVSMPQMARVGLWLNLIGILLLTLAVSFWLPIVWGL